MRVLSASFLGLLGDEASFLEEEERALSSGFNAMWLQVLATVRARRGDMDGAIELLHEMLRRGRTSLHWKLYFSLAAISPLESELFDAFLAEFEAERERLRAIY